MEHRTSVCEECGENPPKYKCPGCSLRSCSLPCVKSHKQRTACTGKRPLTPIVPLPLFDDNLLLSDYNLLEETKRATESAQRRRVQLFEYPQFRFPHHLRILKAAAAKRSTKLLLLPAGMSKRRRNQSCYDKRNKFISWTIEWRFHSTDMVLLDHCVHEDSKLFTVVKNHLKPGPWNHQLKQFEDHLESLKFFICQHPKGPKSPFRELDINAPLRPQLVDVVILEYPVIHVFLPSHSFDFVVKNEHPSTCITETTNYANNGQPCHNGAAFREEEIEDDGSSDPQVYDFMKNENVSQPCRNHDPDISKRGLYNLFDGPLPVNMGLGNISHGSSHSMEAGNFDITEFDFDQGLIDTYSDIIAHINPDDFLDLEGEFSKETVEVRNDTSNSGGIVVEEELEEGEIAE